MWSPLKVCVKLPHFGKPNYCIYSLGIFDSNRKICQSRKGEPDLLGALVSYAGLLQVPFLRTRKLLHTELTRWAFRRIEMASSQVMTPETPKSFLGAAETDADGVHVLAVDDSVIDRRVLENLLKTSAYKVTAVDSGRKALEVLGVGENLGSVTFSVSPTSCTTSSETSTSEKGAVDGVNLIITDYCMPGMSGYDLLKKVKGTSTLKGIPVVVMSSENEPNRINSCLAEGAEEFLLKPVQLADVKRLRGHIRHPQGTIPTEQDTSCLKRRVMAESMPVRSLERRVQCVCHLS